jgi:hypothetical protein
MPDHPLSMNALFELLRLLMINTIKRIERRKTEELYAIG